MIHRVADHVGQGVGQAFDDGLVDLGPLALGPEADLLVDSGGGLADDAGHALKQRFHGLSADHHHAFLYVSRQLHEFVEARGYR